MHLKVTVPIFRKFRQMFTTLRAFKIRFVDTRETYDALP